MFRAGSFVADHVTPVDPPQVQPNGVDLTLGGVLDQRDRGRIARGEATVGERREIETAGGTYALDPGAYVVQYAERVEIPEDHVGFLYPRSSLLRNSCMLDTAVWDAGYEGRGEGLLRVGHGIELERGARVAQFVLAAADHDGTYGGSYQGERTG